MVKFTALAFTDASLLPMDVLFHCTPTGQSRAAEGHLGWPRPRKKEQGRVNSLWMRAKGLCCGQGVRAMCLAHGRETLRCWGAQVDLLWPHRADMALWAHF